MKNQNMNKLGGFTLIELLVVVLIIGILAAVAVPQYQKAVTRTRYGTLKSLTRSIANAQEIFYMANNEYAADFEKLDVQMPGGKLNDSTAYHYVYDWGYCRLEPSTAYAHVSCGNSSIKMQYAIRLAHAESSPGRALCQALGSTSADTLQAQICKAETGRTSPSDTSETSSAYFYE